MKIKLQTMGPDDTEWCTLTTYTWPTGADETVLREQRKMELKLDSAIGNWFQYFGMDHKFRVVKA